MGYYGLLRDVAQLQIPPIAACVVCYPREWQIHYLACFTKNCMMKFCVAAALVGRAVLQTWHRRDWDTCTCAIHWPTLPSNKESHRAL